MKKISKDPKTGRVRVQTVNNMPSKTQQQHADDVDVNKIIQRYLGTGVLPTTKRQAIYADLTQIKDYSTSLNTIIKARETFQSLPSSIRSKFDNDPEKLLQFIQDPKTIDQQIELGLREKPPGWAPKNASNANTQAQSETK